VLSSSVLSSSVLSSSVLSSLVDGAARAEQTPRISVVVIALDEESAIGPSLARLKADADADGAVEIVVADGGSSDGTAEVAGRYARVVVQSGGRAAGLNAGAGAATGDILLFLHADTILPPRAFAVVRRALADPAVAGGRFRVALDNPALPFRIIAGSINLRDRILGGFTGDQAVFVRAAVFRAIGGYAPLPLMEDLDFAARLEGAGRVVRLPQRVITSARRWERHGIVRTVVRMWVLRLLYRGGVHPRLLAPHYRDAR
jgi:rSAM/selenodomain-associated transferase 2